jgi:flavodoxin/ferredoxin
MKNLIIYHTITGNTKKIAQAIYKGMCQTGEKVDIATIKDINVRDLAGYDLIGFGSPVMYMRELHNVTNFVENIESVDGKHCFVFCTHGANPGHYLSRVVPAMEQRGMLVIGWNDWFGGVYYPVVPKPYFTDGHPDSIDLKEAQDFGREMVERSKGIYDGETQRIPEFPKGKKYDDIYDPPEVYEGIPVEIVKRVYKERVRLKFNLNTEKCKYPKCTLCMDNCPMKSIDFTVSPSIFEITCDRCYLCEQICPQGAIEVNYSPFQKAHDSIIVMGIQKSLDRFEARGHFRRLVPLKDIGWDTPFWTFKHPRFKIE